MIKCLNCGKEIENPVSYKGKKRSGNVSRFCRNDGKCRDEYNNKKKDAKGLSREIRELLRRAGVYGKIGIAFEMILKEYHLED